MVIAHITWGDKIEIYAESCFSILTFLADRDVDEICVVTENPEFYACLADRVKVVSIPQDTLKIWNGVKTSECAGKMKKRTAVPRDYTFRGKLKGMEKVIELHPGQDILFVDTDTFLGAPIRPIKEALATGGYFLSEFYGSMARSKLHTTKELWQKLRGKMFSGVTIDENTTIWNSGSVGIPGAKAGEVIATALAVCDEIYMETGFHGAEELAFALALQHYGTVHDTVSIIGHYWTNKKPWDDMVVSFFAKAHLQGWTLEEQMARATATDFRAMPVGIHHPTRRKQLLRFADKYFPPNRPKYYPDKEQPW